MKKKYWCYESKGGLWCATTRKHGDYADNIATVCHHNITLPIGIEFREPNCKECQLILYKKHFQSMVTVKIVKKDIRESLVCLMNSCVEGRKGEWDAGSEEGRESFEPMYDSLASIAEALGINVGRARKMP